MKKANKEKCEGCPHRIYAECDKLVCEKTHMIINTALGLTALVVIIVKKMLIK